MPLPTSCAARFVIAKYRRVSPSCCRQTVKMSLKCGVAFSQNMHVCTRVNNHNVDVFLTFKLSTCLRKKKKKNARSGCSTRVALGIDSHDPIASGDFLGATRLVSCRPPVTNEDTNKIRRPCPALQDIILCNRQWHGTGPCAAIATSNAGKAAECVGRPRFVAHPRRHLLNKDFKLLPNDC